jgi:DNA mismatch endonuclease (patch repair protein)
MTDVHSKATRSYNMSRIRSRDTAPEKLVRSMVHKMGLRFRLFRPDLPGKPDLYLPRHQTVILVHGCFWHCHGCKVGGKMRPKTNTSYWSQKLQRNLQRDRENIKALKALGLRVVIIWECWTRNPVRLKNKLNRLLAAILRKASMAETAPFPMRSSHPGRNGPEP